MLGKLLQFGEILTRKRLADTLEKIGRYGAQVFYEGEMANATIAAVQRTNGTMTIEDLRNYNISIRPPISIDYRGHKLYSCGAPSSGSVALSTLKIIEGYDDTSASAMNLTTHRLDEAMRYSYGAHAELGDPKFVKGLDAFEAEMLMDSTAKSIRANISDTATKNVSAYDPKMYEARETHGTSHVVTADASGMSITLTTTVNLLFGSQVMVPETGIIMNNEMNDFSIPHVSNAFGFVPSPSNFIRPGKRPLSSITPIIAEYPNGDLYISIGAAGGSRIITATLQALWHIIDHNMTVVQALAEPRMHDQLLPNVVAFEWPGRGQRGFDNSTVESMREKGHNVTWIAEGSSAVQGIVRLVNGTFEAAGEPRQINAAGYAV